MLKDNHIQGLSSQLIEERLENNFKEYERRISFLQKISHILTLLVILFSFLIISGWVFNIPLLRGDILGFYASKFNTALTFLIAGLSLFLLQNFKENRILKTISRILAVFVLLIGIITLSEYVLGLNFGMDQLFYSQQFLATNELYMGRPKLLTAFTLIFIGIGLSLLTFSNKNKIIQIFALLSGFLVFYGFMINIYGIQLNHIGDFYFQMGIYTAIMGLLLSSSILFHKPDTGIMKTITSPYSGGKISRILIVGSIAIVFGVGLITRLGENLGIFSQPVGTGLLVVASSSILFLLILWTGKKINKMDLEQEKALKTIKNLEQFYERIIESLNEGIFVTNKDDEVIYFNAALKHINGLESFNLNDIDYKFPHLDENFLEYYSKAKNTLQPTYFETLPLDTGGETFYFTGWILPKVKNDKFNGSILTLIDDTQRKSASDEVKTSLKEKETLLREIHHRVKNNLQIISSLLNLQSSYALDDRDRELFYNTQNRVKSMALIHSKLYQSDTISNVNFKEYVKTLAEDLVSSYQTTIPIKLKIDMEEVFFNLETAIPCGLIITELITNSLKYAFKDKKSGNITIKLISDQNRELSLIISDDGIGLSESVDFKKTDTLGLELVRMLVKQIEGSVNITRSPGTTFTIKFKELNYPERT